MDSGSVAAGARGAVVGEGGVVGADAPDPVDEGVEDDEVDEVDDVDDVVLPESDASSVRQPPRRRAALATTTQPAAARPTRRLVVVVPDGVRFTLQSTHQTPARFPGGGDDVTLCVAGEVANAPSSAKRATEQRSTPLCLALDRDVVLMDIRMPTVDGIKASRQIVTAGHRARVLILTTYDLDEHPYATIRAGTRGFILKTESTPRLLGAIRAAAAGDTVLAPEIARRLLERFVDVPPSGSAQSVVLDVLSEREREVLTLMARGLTNDEIAATIHVSVATVKSHVTACSASSERVIECMR